MSGTFPRFPEVAKTYEQATPVDPQGRGSGWGGRTVFAGIWLVLIGVLHSIWAIVALAKPEYFSEDKLVWENLAAWGWIILLVGVAQLAIGVLVLRRTTAGRALGVIAAALGVILNFFTIGAHPASSIVLLAGSALVIWALTAED